MHSFKTTLRKLALFVLTVFLLSESMVIPYFYGETFYYQDGYVREQFAGQLDLLVCGASQSLRGISPAILDEELGCNSYNLASPIMPMKQRYTLLKNEMERNPVDTVIVEVCYDTLVRDREEVGPEGDFYILGRFTNPWDRIRFLAGNMRFSEIAEFYADSLVRSTHSLKVLLLGGGRRGSSESYVCKGYYPLESGPVELEPDSLRESIPTEPAGENLFYLEQILSLCTRNGCRTILVSTPLSRELICNLKGLDTVRQQYTALAEKYGIPFRDFNLLKGGAELFRDDRDFYNKAHLSTCGSRSFTKLLSQELKDPGSVPFYESYPEMLREEFGIS